MVKKIFTKKTSKADSKKTSTKKGAKKKKIIKSTEKAVKKKMAPTKKTKYVQGKNTSENLADIGLGNSAGSVSNASDLVDDLSNGELSEEDQDNTASGKMK